MVKQEVSLIFPPGWDSVTPPLGISSIKSFLQNKDINVITYDFSVKMRGRFFKGSAKELDKCIRDILNQNPKYIGFTLLYPNFKYSMYMAKKIKQENKDIKIVVGGPQSSYLKNEIFNHNDFIDFCIQGEGEKPFYDLIINKKSNSRFIKPVFIENINNLPFPNFDDYDLDSYPVKMLPISSTRGCNRKCTFCGITGNKVSGPYRKKNPTKVISEINNNIANYSINNFLFVDADLNSNSKHLNDLCDCIIKENIDIQWAAEAQPNISKELIDKMYDSGCRFLWLSPETGSKYIMKKMKKGVDIDKAKETINYAGQKGIFISTWFILGFPGETEEDIKQTIDFAKSIKKNCKELLFVPFTLMKGSYIFRNPNDFGIKNINRLPCDIWCTYDMNYPSSELDNVQLTLSLWEDFNDLNVGYPFLDDYTDEEIEGYIESLDKDKKVIVEEYLKKTKNREQYSYGTIFKRIFN